MSLHPVVRQFLDSAEDMGDPLAPPARRRAEIIAAADEMYLRTGLPGEPADVDDRWIDVDGGTLRLRRYRPVGATDADVLPVHVFLHGGGWWLSSIDELVNDALCRARCARLGITVVAVDYRMAPEHPFPVPFDDCYAALTDLAEHAAQWLIDPANISIGGVSAGANLAAAVALASRDRGGPALRLVLLEVPVVDLTLDTMRSSGVPDDYGITVPGMERCVELYLPDAALARDPRVSPLFAADLTGFPATRVLTAEFDPLRRDGQLFADRLRASGVPVEHTVYPGAIHGSLSLTGVWAPARQWWDDAVDALRTAHRSPALSTAPAVVDV
ncbi:alpha/beta hydrolase [Nakamurella flava]|uniref:Alpha/beta hydrolase n=1 Tax=Nakamurella flava TaxID=2576308 RepID=A0A4U6QLH7_9ACTN|nr:alpha/beta hydrolase [Nakamurella flava]TKV61016.1 alpha/beta hydrolase [Nakamurella flava]